MNNKCCICSQIRGVKENDLISNLLEEKDYKRRVILENEDFAVLPSLGGLVRGHLLICPKEHVKSFSQISKKYFSSYKEIKKMTISILAKKYRKKIHLFEHGTAIGSTKTICTVDHAHMHILPTDVEILDSFNGKYEWEEVRIESINELQNTVAFGEYIYYESPDGKKMISTSPDGFESQYMRQVFAKSMGVSSEWNWRESPNPKNANSVYEELSA